MDHLDVLSHRSPWPFVVWVVTVAVLLALPAVVGGGLIDDAYIFCRYAVNIAAGRGPVFNAGEPVEGYTSPLHLALISAGSVAGLDAPRVARWLSMMAAAAVLLVLCLVSSTKTPAVGPAAALLTAAAAPYSLWASTGMETTVFTLVVLGGVLGFEHTVAARGYGNTSLWIPYATWALISLAPLARPEGVLLTLIAIAHEIARGRTLRRPLPLLPALSLFPLVASVAFRVWYYHAWLPNTFYAKVGSGGWPLLRRGMEYLLNASVPVLPLVVVAALYTLKWTTTPGLSFRGWLMAAFVAGIIAEGGDEFAMGRFIVPLIPLVALSAAEGLTSPHWSKGVRPLLTGSVVGLELLWSLWAPGILCTQPTATLAHFREEVMLARTWDRMGSEMAAQLGPRHVVALSNAGAIPYRTGWQIVDMGGLLDSHIAHLPVKVGGANAGGEKHDAEYVLGRQPDLIMIHTWLWSRAVPDDAALVRVTGEANLEMAASPRFRSRYRLAWLELPGAVVALYVLSP